MNVLLLDKKSPLSERLIQEISELSDVHVRIQEPSDWEQKPIEAEPRFDVILIDIDQSQGLGLDSIRRLRGRRGAGGPIIMVISSSPFLQYRANCLEAGAMYFFNRVREQDWLLDSLVAIQEQIG
jgi:DNA-binding response OmpR family regulator